MKCTLHSPSFLVRNAHSYCFRLIVPKDLQKFVGKTELRYTLRTGYLGIAKRKSRFLAGQVQFIFQLLRKGFVGMGKLSENQVQQLVVAYIKRSIEGLDEVFDQGQNENLPYHDPPSFFSYLKEQDIIKEDLMINLNLGDYSMLESSIDNFLKENGITEVDKTSPEYRKLCIEIHKAESKIIPIQQKHMQLDFSYKEQLPQIFPEAFKAKNDPPPVPAGDQTPPKKKQKSATVGKVLKEYWEEREPTWKPRSKTEIRRALDHLIEFVGKDSDICEVDGEVLRRYKQKLMKEKIAPGKTRSVKTVNDKYLTFQKTFFTWAKNNSYITQNPVEGLSIKERKDKRPDEEQDPFSKDDLKMMFVESQEYGQDQMEKPYQFWMPLIGLYTGMRIEEICQLYVSDLRKIDGIWCFDINQNKPDKSVKTAERRIVPFHPFLANDLNFVGYVGSLPDKEGRIFPELKRIKNRYSHHASPWFSDFKKRCGIEAAPRKKTFHSFRHTVIDHLLQKDVQDRVISMLVGHSIQGQTKGRYGKRLKPKKMYEKAVLQLDYGIDLSHLKHSKWVVK